MSVEKRRRPIAIGKTGVMLPCTMAWTAMGMKGVVVAALVSVAAGEGVMTKKVGVSCVGAGVWLAADSVAVGDATTDVAVASGVGACGAAVGRFINNRTAATATESRPPIRDQRARLTYLRFMR